MKRARTFVLGLAVLVGLSTDGAAAVYYLGIGTSIGESHAMTPPIALGVSFTGPPLGVSALQTEFTAGIMPTVTSHRYDDGGWCATTGWHDAFDMGTYQAVMLRFHPTLLVSGGDDVISFGYGLGMHVNWLWDLGRSGDSRHGRFDAWGEPLRRSSIRLQTTSPRAVLRFVDFEALAPLAASSGDNTLRSITVKLGFRLTREG